MPPRFDYSNCVLCGECVDMCPLDVLAMTDTGPEVRYADECWHCGNCRLSCPNDAVSIIFPLAMLV
ncbi:MAG: 4Fe-4S binding protein [Peptococcaceae bacterium]|nr:4Fe-4S binding protein [Peptococcaceae bacterium]